MLPRMAAKARRKAGAPSTEAEKGQALPASGAAVRESQRALTRMERLAAAAGTNEDDEEMY